MGFSYTEPYPDSIYEFKTVTAPGRLSYPNILEPSRFNENNESEPRKFRTQLICIKEDILQHPFLNHVFGGLYTYAGKLIGASTAKTIKKHPWMACSGIKIGDSIKTFVSPDKLDNGELRDEGDYVVISASTGEKWPPQILYQDGMSEKDIFPGANAQLLLGLYTWKEGTGKDGVKYPAGININLKAVLVIPGGTSFLTGSISETQAKDVFQNAQAALPQGAPTFEIDSSAPTEEPAPTEEENFDFKDLNLDTVDAE